MKGNNFRGNNLPLTRNASSLKDINLDTNIPLTGSEGSRMAPCSQRLTDLQPDQGLPVCIGECVGVVCGCSGGEGGRMVEDSCYTPEI